MASTRTAPRTSDRSTVPGCFVRIRDAFKSLTDGERRVAEAILRDPHAAILASVTELARRGRTSPAAVSRFCRKLGFGNFPHFKIRLARDLALPISDIHQDVTADDRMEEITRKVFHGNIQTLTDTLQVLDAQEFEAAVDLLANAPRITFFGAGGSGIVAQDAAHKFMRTGKTTVAYTDKHLQIIHGSLLGPPDVVVAISHTGRNRDLLDVLRVVKGAGAHVVAITHYGPSPIAGVADVTLHTTSRETAYRRESLSSRIAALSIVDALYVGVGVRLHKDVVRNISTIRQALLCTRLEGKQGRSRLAAP